jgi:spermidine/putrescine transport system permease protein
METGAEYIRESDLIRFGLFFGIPTLVLVVFFILPLIAMARLSFFADMPPAALTLEQYSRIFFDEIYRTVLWRTTVLTVQTTVIVVLLGYTLAYSIARFSKRTTLVLLLIILPFWTNYIVRMYALINIFQYNGVLDTVMLAAGLAAEPSGMMYTDTAVFLGLTYVWLPLATFPFYASLTNMDTDLIEASKDLGAGPAKTFLRVTLPMTKNGLIAGIVLVSVPTFGSFVTPALLGGTDVVMVGMVIEQQFGSAFNWPFGSALGVVVTAIVVLVVGLGFWLGASGQLGGEST